MFRPVNPLLKVQIILYPTVPFKYSIIYTLDNGLTFRNILHFYYSLFSFVERHLVNPVFLNFKITKQIT
jgi:hypothetical protein